MMMRTTMNPKGFLFEPLEMLADVCCDILDHKRTLSDNDEPNIKEEQPVLDMVQALKFAPHVFYFPTKSRLFRKRKVLIMINNDHRDLSHLPPMKRCRFDVDHGDEDGQNRAIQTEVKKQKMKKTSTTTTRRKKDLGKNGIMAGPNPAPAMRIDLMEMAVGDFDLSTVKLVIQKSLFETDLQKGQNRISMPLKQIKSDDFLTEEEKRTLERRREDKHLEGIEVDFISPDLSKTKMMFKKWDLQKSSSYILSRNWHNVAQRNKLKASDIVQIWFFRSREGKPCIALVNLGREPSSSLSSASASSSVGEDDHQRSDSEPRSTVTA
ncbi:hypothetical protein TIFTF001_012935 [Ficus carica]|uniref:B3 domain-containing protein n=1 Tax=Ficus carica TaxID=3494 RepID=A0AA88AGW1_FICCA|nr:hypothetical protein TIFTF001_012935 [Ficus carica]